AYSECFPPEPRSPILLISQIEPASRIRAHTVCSASSEELKPEPGPRTATVILASKKTTVEGISLGTARPRSEIIEEEPTACP
ncbi:MAG: hypothetical protein K0Q57_953, partial [Gammaproteobacteria bacterium]|nr:hypothetical protein [Gammaproteobacteria bacterium]